MAYSTSIAFTTDHTQVGGSTLTDFPVLIRGTFPAMRTVANGGSVQNLDTGRPADLVFAPNADGSSKYNFEIVEYAAATGVISAWVKIPSLSASTDLTFYCACGDAAVTTYQGNDAGTWETNFKLVWHLKDGTTLSGVDSTSSANNGTVSGATATAGQIGGAASFNGTTDKIASGSTVSIPAQRTWSAWVYHTGGHANGRVFDLNDRGNLYASAGNFLVLGAAASSGTWSWTAPSDNAWHLVHVVYDNSASANDPVVYVDGSLAAGFANVSRFTAPADTTAQTLTVGNRAGADRGWGGKIDEVRIADTLRSSGWVTAEYNNQKANSTFIRPAMLTGTATMSITESDIVAGGKTIVITLVGDTWVPE